MERGLQSVICTVGTVGQEEAAALTEERSKAVKHCLKIQTLDGKPAQVLHLNLRGTGHVEQYAIIAQCNGSTVERTYGSTEFYQL